MDKDREPFARSDRSGFVVEKAFAHKITVARPTNQQAWFIPSTKIRIVVLWIRIENLSHDLIARDSSSKRPSPTKSPWHGQPINRPGSYQVLRFGSSFYG